MDQSWICFARIRDKRWLMASCPQRKNSITVTEAEREFSPGSRSYLLIYLLTPWCRILFEKLIVTQLFKEYPAFLWNPEVHYRAHTSPPLEPILSQMTPVRPIDPCLHKVHLNVILPPTPVFSVVPSLGVSQPKPCKHLSPPPCPAHLILLDLITLTIFGARLQIGGAEWCLKKTSG
jgi:hypothetical protein